MITFRLHCILPRRPFVHLPSTFLTLYSLIKSYVHGNSKVFPDVDPESFPLGLDPTMRNLKVNGSKPFK